MYMFFFVTKTGSEKVVLLAEDIEMGWYRLSEYLHQSKATVKQEWNFVNSTSAPTHINT